MHTDGPILTEEHLSHLAEHGYVVVNGVMTPQECDAAYANLVGSFSLWDERISLDVPESTRQKHMPPGTIHGISRAFAHQQGQWDVRQHPRVARAFADWWMKVSPAFAAAWRASPDDSLVVSMDAFNFYHGALPPHPSAKTFWCHTDQAPHVSGDAAFCLQGYVDLVGSEGAGDGTLVVWDKAHRIHKTYFERHPEEAKKAGGNWYRYPEEFIARIERNGADYLSHDDVDSAEECVPMPRVNVHAPKGALVLWRSTTPHMNRAPVPPAKHRCVVYVCMAPEAALTDKDREARYTAWEEKMQTSHWPAFGQVKVFPAVPRLYSREEEQEKKPRLLALRELLKRPEHEPRLSLLGKKLLGVRPEHAPKPKKAPASAASAAKSPRQTILKVIRDKERCATKAV